MEKNCYNCGASMDERSPFCPSCGAAQIRVSSREASPQTPENPVNTSGNPSSLQGPENYSSVPMLPGEPPSIQWQRYFKAAWPLALGAGIATGFFPPFGFLLFLPIGVIVSLRLYRKHHPGQIRAGQGALLGAAFSVLSTLVAVAVFALVYSPTSGPFREALMQALNNSPARESNPEGAQAMRNLLESPSGLQTLLSFAAFMLFCFDTFFSCLAGVLAATMGQHKPKP